MNINREIALWGPTGSGKTWLIRSFGKALFNMSNKDPLFNYYILDGSGQRIDIFKPPIQQATEDPYDVIWQFRREIKTQNNAKHVNCQAHTIIVHDAKGEALISLQDNVVKFGIEDSEHVLMMLDFTRLTDFTIQTNQASSTVQGGFAKLIPQSGGSGSQQPASSTAGFTRADYTQFVTNILQTLTNPIKPNRRVAICLSKMDQLKIQGREPWRLVEMLFGSDMKAQLEYFSRMLTLDVFPLSAVGYIGTGSERKSNLHQTSSGNWEIMDPGQWQPEGVEAPFFWLFDHVERQRLQNNGEGIVKFLYQGTRQKEYIKYPLIH
jgi:hypothetical protein